MLLSSAYPKTVWTTLRVANWQDIRDALHAPGWDGIGNRKIFGPD